MVHPSGTRSGATSDAAAFRGVPEDKHHDHVLTHPTAALAQLFAPGRLELEAGDQLPFDPVFLAALAR